MNDLQVDFMNDPGNAHLFPDSEIHNNPEPEQEEEPAPKKNKGGKRTAKEGDKATPGAGKKKEPELACAAMVTSFKTMIVSENLHSHSISRLVEQVHEKKLLDRT